MEKYEVSPDMSSRFTYEMTDDEVTMMSKELLSRHTIESDSRYVTACVAGDDPAANLGRFIEHQVFNESFGNDIKDMEDGYGDYEKYSTFFITLDRQSNRPAGVLRVIADSNYGLKTLNDLSDPDVCSQTSSVSESMEFHGIDSLENTWDVGTVAVPKAYRRDKGSSGQDISVQLYRSMYVSAMQQNIDHVVSIIDARAYKTMTEYLGIPFVALAGNEPLEYMGSENSQPVYGHLPDFYKSMNRKRLFTIKGLLARKALGQLVKGNADKETILFDTTINK